MQYDMHLFISWHLQFYVYMLQQNDDLLFALRMLSLGLGAWQIIDSQVFTEPKLVSVIQLCTAMFCLLG